jgi:hypothetical protein
LAADEVVEARSHVEDCPACQRALAYDATLLSAFDRLREEALPLALRERVLDLLARTRTFGGSSSARRNDAWYRRHLVAFATLGAAAVAALSAVVVLMDRPAQAEFGPMGAGVREADAFIEDYVRRAVREDHIATSDPSLVVRFLARELGLVVGLVDMEGYDLEGAEVCLLEGRRGAMVVYRRADRIVSFYVLPRSGGAAAPPRVRSAVPAPAGTGASVVTWASTDAEFALVGPVNPGELLAAARGATGAGAH